MDDLLQSQILESCKLALPAGLQELMSDISREVLRSQPENLYQFIANYLEALLNTREALSIACNICGEVGNCSCQPQLDIELSRIGLSEDDVTKAKDIILDHFDKGKGKETNLLIKLATKTNVTETQLIKVQKAIQRAFQRYIAKSKDLQVSFATFHGYSTESSEGNSGEYSSVSTQSSVSDFYKPSYSITTIEETQNIQSIGYPLYNPTVSATTLAGSYINLPRKIPYSVHNSDGDNILIKSEKSVLKLLKSFIFSEERQYLGIPAVGENVDTYESFDSVERQHADSVEIDDTIKSIFSQDIYSIRSRQSRSSSRAIFNAIQENLDESSSGGS